MILVPLLRDHKTDRACRDFGDTLLALRRATSTAERDFEELDDRDSDEPPILHAVPSE